jgi:hypothetical protein
MCFIVPGKATNAGPVTGWGFMICTPLVEMEAVTGRAAGFGIPPLIKILNKPAQNPAMISAIVAASLQLAGSEGTGKLQTCRHIEHNGL